MNISKRGFAILDLKSARWFGRSSRRFAATLCGSAIFSCIFVLQLAAQTVGTGSVAGVIADAKGKALAGARVEITNRATFSVIHEIASSAGWYSSGPIQPGNYTLQVEAKGFDLARVNVGVHVGSTTTANVRMQPGHGSGPVVEVLGGSQVNVVQASVQDLLNEAPLERYPINARSFFAFASLDPGLQVQDGGVLDPTKNGIYSESLLSHYGRDLRISLDGTDISDEIVGGSTQNIPAGAIQEMQIEQSLLNLSTPPTASGALNLITRSGSDQIHGDLFGTFRGDQGAASQPGRAPQSFQRELFGGEAGGAIIKDKIFWFADAERAKQDLTEPEPFAYPFDTLYGYLAEPYREFDTDERVDWKMRGSTRVFYRFNFFQNTDLRPFGAASSTQRLSTDNNNFTNTVGIDFNTGAYAHSFRVEYLKLRSSVVDATAGLGPVENPIPGLGINIGASIDGNCALSEGGSYCGGPSWFGPEREYQSDKLVRYDGGRVWRDHVVRYGVYFNRIAGGRFTDFAASPQVGTTSAGTLASSDPTSYAADFVTLGNGVGLSTPYSAFGLSGGGVGPDNRLQMYVTDAFRLEPHVTLTYGVQYLHDSMLTDSNLGSLPLLNQWGPGYGDKIRNPNLDFAPQAGLAWDVGGTGTSVIRLGAGLVWADPLLNNISYDTAARMANGNFLSTPQVCNGGIGSAFPWPTALTSGSSIAGGAATAVTTQTGVEALPTFCGGTISAVAPAILALSSAYQGAAASVPAGQPNPNYVGSALSALSSRGYDLLYPAYRTPRSYQMNLGFEKAIGSSTRISIDYLRNIGEHFLIGQDINHSGAARSFNQANAVQARDAAQTANGCPAGFGEATCMVAKLGQAGAQAAYSRAGLDSNQQTSGGGPCSYCAFPGTNGFSTNSGAVGGVDMLFPDGRSLYSGFQAKMAQHLDKPFRGVKHGDFQISYTYSKYNSPVQGQDSLNYALDNDNLARFSGPNGLDRKHQFSFGGTFQLPWFTRLSMFGHFYSPLAENLLLPELTNGGEIFATDWLGAGLPASGSPEPLPGTQIGQYERGTPPQNLSTVISQYNHIYAGGLTPAGECLVGNTSASNPYSCPGLISGPLVMTPADMTALGWVLPTLGSVAPNAAGVPWLKSMDMKLSWPFKIKDRFTVEPSASAFNVFNFWNAFLPGNSSNASLLPGQNGLLAPSVTGGVAPGSSLTPFRANFQSGTFAMGTPRQFEFGLRISF